MKKRLYDIINSIKPLECPERKAIQKHLDNLTKPRKSLGRLEELAEKFICVKGKNPPIMPRKTIMVFAGDHGITEEVVSAFPKEVTFQMVHNFLNGGAGINVLARHSGATVTVIDIGVDHDFEAVEGLISMKTDYGTGNMVTGPAMTLEKTLETVMTGVKLAEQADKEGFSLIGTGEMGIGNTTPASAVTSIICDKKPEEVTGRGTGIDDDVYARKINLIKKAIDLNNPDSSDPLDTLSKLGGYEIAGICGLILGAASRNIPVVTDGFISTSGAIVAKALCPHISDYLFASHQSVEQGHKIQLEYLGLTPLLYLDLRLGEGTGAALAMGLIDAGLKIYLEMATFENASVASSD